ncbi:MAG: hypothetical protein WKF82_10885 [Nocardioidaceae bacterium]
MHDMFPPSEALRHADACGGDDSEWLRSAEVYANMTAKRRRQADRAIACALDAEQASGGAVHTTVSVGA